MNHHLAKLWLWLWLLPGLVFALPEDRQQPIELRADGAELDQSTGVSTYTGNVVISQGSLRLTADTARIYITDGEFERMEARGSPSTLRYRPSADKPPIEGVGQRVEYNAVSGKVTVSGQARFTQGGDVFTGQQISYDLAKDRVSAQGTDREQIHFTIQPRNSGQ